MKFHSIGTRAALLSNDLPDTYDISLPHQQAAVMPVGTDIDVIVLENNQFTEAHNAGTRVDHSAIGDRVDGIPAVAPDIYALVYAGGIAPGDTAAGRPAP